MKTLSSLDSLVLLDVVCLLCIVPASTLHRYLGIAFFFGVMALTTLCLFVYEKEVKEYGIQKEKQRVYGTKRSCLGNGSPFL